MTSNENRRLEQQRQGSEDWHLWGPYLAERAWATVREDYSRDGTVWEYFDHKQACSCAYRWNEDGLGGISDRLQRLCFALALWNGKDPILKERAFGLTGIQGNHGEDVKEYYFYQDATPSHDYLRYLYKYPQQSYPYRELIEENARRSRNEPSYNLLDTGIFSESRHWDITVEYARTTPQRIHIRITAANRGPETAALQLLPTLWFRNTWSWDTAAVKPVLKQLSPPAGDCWAVLAEHHNLGRYYLYGPPASGLLFTENETNQKELYGTENVSPYTRDAFHRYLIDGETTAVNPTQTGTRFAAILQVNARAWESCHFDLVLAAGTLNTPFANGGDTMAMARADADAYYAELLPDAGSEDRLILRQALAGMIWNKQFYHYDVDRWLEGDRIPPPAQRRQGRNHGWRHLHAADIISMPDCWEYPWFAAWDLAYHCAVLAHIDVDFAKSQIELLLHENYLHPNGQLPAYEWILGDVNPPVHAMGALKVFRAERVQCGTGDTDYLQRVVHKLLLNYAWWLNRKDREGHNIFEGGFLGLDNISVYNRSQPLAPGFSLRQADATGWMAMFALNMTVMALEIATRDPDYENIAIQCNLQFLVIANAIAGGDGSGLSLWDEEAGFFKDVVLVPDGGGHRIDVYSWVGLIPLFACEVIDQRLLCKVPRFRELLHAHKGGLFRGTPICACPDWENARGEHLLADRLVNLYRRDARGRIPAVRGDCPLQDDPHWQGLYLFYKYFHAETGQGLGAAHQTGWTGLMANLIMRRYRKDIPGYWRARDPVA